MVSGKKDCSLQTFAKHFNKAGRKIGNTNFEDKKNVSNRTDRLRPSSESGEIASLELIILNLSKLQGREEEGITPKQSKGELEAIVLATSSVLEKGKKSLLLSEETTEEKEGEAKFQLTFRKKLERLLYEERSFQHLEKQNLHNFGMKYKKNEYIEPVDNFNVQKQRSCNEQ